MRLTSIALPEFGHFFGACAGLEADDSSGSALWVERRAANSCARAASCSCPG